MESETHALTDLSREMAVHEIRLTHVESDVGNLQKFAESMRWTPIAKAAIFGPVLAGVVAIIGLLITKGGAG